MTSGLDWAEQGRALVDTLRSVLGSLAEHDDRAPGEAPAQAAECRWCPLCQLIAVLRGERPEVTEALADVLRATADALHAFAAAPDGTRPAGPPAEEESAPPAGGPPPVVQRIEIA
jgi:hypothetical protein